MEFKSRSRIPMHLDMAPLIDVVFLLLIFFMLTSTLISQEALEINLPNSSESLPIEVKDIEVALTKEGKYFLNGKELPMTQLKQQLSILLQSSSDKRIILKTDSNATVQAVITGMDLIRSAGGRNISLATERE